MDGSSEKITQLINFFIRKNSNSRIQKLKAIKLIWAADRYHLRKYGRLVSGDNYRAMQYGPVGSNTKNIAEADPYYVNKADLSYIENYIKPDEKKLTLFSHKDIDSNKLSRTDEEALNFAWQNFGSLDGFEIAKISHQYPEWLNQVAQLESGNKNPKIDVTDFFDNPGSLNLLQSDPFAMDDELVESSREIYLETA